MCIRDRAKGAGLTTLEAVVLSLTNLTSAGQFAGLGIITAGSSLLEMALTQLIINLRYCLMSCSLSQKLDSHMPFFHRLLMSYGITDEIFGVSVCKSGILSPYFSYGLMAVAVPGWTIGTLLGAVSGSLLPARLLSALNVALYGMSVSYTHLPGHKKFISLSDSYDHGRAELGILCMPTGRTHHGPFCCSRLHFPAAAATEAPALSPAVDLASCNTGKSLIAWFHFPEDLHTI